MIRARERFRANPDFMKRWPDIVDSPIFHEAVMAAHWEMTEESHARSDDAATAAAIHFRSEGVKKFLSILMTLADPQGKPGVRISDNLNHRI